MKKQQWTMYFKQVDGSYIFGWGLPVVFIVFCGAMFHTGGFYAQIMRGELGIVELFQVAVLCFALVLSLVLFCQKEAVGLYWKIIKYVIPVGLIYLIGEEISWGQHFFGWETPELWQELNHQKETNLHNAFGIFDVVPRLLLQTFIFFSCFVWPWLDKRKPVLNWMVPYMPDATSFLLAVIMLWIKARHIVPKYEPLAFLSKGEMLECMMYIFIASILITVLRRHKKATAAAQKTNQKE